jgi:hypothetical protein
MSSVNTTEMFSNKMLEVGEMKKYLSHISRLSIFLGNFIVLGGILQILGNCNWTIIVNYWWISIGYLMILGGGFLYTLLKD